MTDSPEPLTDPPDDATGGELVEKLNRSQGPLANKLGITITAAELGADGDHEDDVLVATMPVHGNTQPFGLLHGGATAVLVESLGSIYTVAVHGDRIPVGVDLNVTHHRGATSGAVIGTARPLFVGRSTVTVEVVVTNEDGQRTATGRLTCRVLGPRPA